MTDTPDLKDALDAFQRGDLDRARAIAQQNAAGGAASPKVDHLLGLIHCQMGDPRTGAEHLRQAAEAEPGNPHHLVMLARALVDSGQPARVLELRKPIADDGPAALALWHARAEAAAAAGDQPAAAEAWQAFAAAQPNDWRAWDNYGDVLAKLERWGEAAMALGKAVQLNPTDARLRRNLAAALVNGGWIEESATEFRDALALDPADAASAAALARAYLGLRRYDEALEVLDEAERRGGPSTETDNLRGGTLMWLRRYEEAEHLYRRILERSPNDPTAVHQLGLILNWTNRSDELAELVEGAEQRGIDQSGLTYLQASMALRQGDPAEALALIDTKPSVAEPLHVGRLRTRAADALGESAAAFEAAEAMNRAYDGYEDLRAVGAAYRANLRDIAAAITPEWARRIVRLAPGDRPSPVFLVGFPRSGTTLLDTFLLGHPQTAVLEETRLILPAELVAGRIVDLPNLAPATLEQARAAYEEELSKHVDRSFTGLVVDKQPFSMLAAPLIHAMFPDVRFIFAQRHPCDAVLSCFMQAFAPNEAMVSFLDIGDAADLYDAAMEVWTRSRGTLPLNVHTVVYEELVADAEGVLRPLIDFLELDWRDELLDHQSTAMKRSAIPTPSYDQVAEPLSERASGRWRRYEEQLAPVLPVLLPWAKRLGYGD